MSSAMMSSGLPCSAALLEDRHQVAGGADLLLVDEDVGVFEDGLHRVGVGDEVGREVALVELHAFDELDGGVEALAFFDGDDAVLADLVHGVGDHLADLLVLVGRGGADLGDFLGAFDLLGHLLELVDDGLDGHVDAALDLRGVGAGGDVLEALR